MIERIDIEGEKIGVVIVEDLEMMRVGIKKMLEGYDGIEVTGEAETVAQGFSVISKKTPDIVLLDVKLGNQSGVSLLRMIKDDPSLIGVKVVMLTIYDDIDIFTEAVRSGASGYLMKDCGREQLIYSIHAAARGEMVVTPSIMEKSAVSGSIKPDRLADLFDLESNMGKVEKLTRREIEILRVLSHGYSNREIARALNITENTVKVHVRNIFKKLDVSSRSQIITMAIKHGII